MSHAVPIAETAPTDRRGGDSIEPTRIECWACGREGIVDREVARCGGCGRWNVLEEVADGPL